MRALAVCLLAAGCHGSSGPAAPPSPPSLALELALAAPAAAVGDLEIAAAGLHVQSLTAVSDRSADDARARLDDLEVAMGGSIDALLSPPPGLYSRVNAVLDGADGIGVDLAGAWGGKSLHVQLAPGPFVVACASPARLDPGQRVQLRLRSDPGRWLDHVDLSQAVSDADDDGILISDDDNRPLAAAVRANVVASFTLDCALVP
jgi:hypothetical protein